MDLVDRAVRLINTNRLALAIIVVAIIAIAVFLRTGLLQYPGLFEPDGYYYYAVVKATLANHLMEPTYFALSGFGPHNIVGEAPGLIYISAIAYTMLGWLGISALQVMRWMPVLFGLLTSVACYFLVRYLADSRIAGLLAMFFVAISSGNLARTTALVYRGDTFVTLFMVLSLIFMMAAFRGGVVGNRRYISAALSALFLSLGVVFWNGAPFMTMVYMVALVLVLIFGFIKRDRDLLSANLVLAEFLFLAYLLEHIYGWLGLARTGLLLIDSSFFVFYVPILVGCFLAWYTAKSQDRFRMLEYARMRILIAAIAIVAVVVIGAVTFNSGAATLTNAIALTNTNVAQSSAGAAANSTLSTAIGTTTQELQKASFNFLFTSFGLELFLAPIGVALYIIAKRRVDQYLLAMLAYLFVTVVMQAGQIRFNSLLSVPIAVFAAYGAYEIGRQLYGVRLTDRVTKVVAAVAICLIVLAVGVFRIGPNINAHSLSATAGYLINAPFSLNAQIGLILEGSTVALEVLFGLTVVYLIVSIFRPEMRMRYVFVLLLAAVMLFGFYQAYATSITSSPADGVNSEFLSAMAWLSANTPQNATVLTIWPDGSVVEAVGNRQSYTDSVGGENGTKIQLTSQYLFNTTPDTQFLNSIGRPDYLVTRGFWFQEIYGLATEGLVSNITDYGYQTFTGLNVTRGQNITVYGFYSSQPPYYSARMRLITAPDGSRTADAYLGVQGTNNVAQLGRIILYDARSLNYSTVYANTNATLNYTLLVSYDGSSIVGGALLGPKLVQSNLFNLILMCNYYSCPVDSANLTYQAVYINNDTRIFKLVYGK
ncbi:MAG TPA: STT3 domain-containing protein [Candidatus Baltobacteraceae bacterium]|nr:STT3 domain-containing protein [Candidatus Baltobacteraceae bacterium]